MEKKSVIFIISYRLMFKKQFTIFDQDIQSHPNRSKYLIKCYTTQLKALHDRSI